MSLQFNHKLLVMYRHDICYISSPLSWNRIYFAYNVLTATVWTTNRRLYFIFTLIVLGETVCWKAGPIKGLIPLYIHTCTFYELLQRRSPMTSETEFLLIKIRRWLHTFANSSWIVLNYHINCLTENLI